MIRNKSTINEFLKSDEMLKLLEQAIEQLTDKSRYQLDIGKVLFGNGTKANAYTITPYDIGFCKNGTARCKIAVCFGDTIQSTEYNSRFEPKKPIEIMRGYLFSAWGIPLAPVTETTIKLYALKWPGDMCLADLKSAVQWESYPILHNGKPIHLHDQSAELENEYFSNYNGDTFSGTSAKNSKIEISNLGRVRINGKVKTQSYDEKNKLLYIPVESDMLRIYIHRLAGEVFLEKPNGFDGQIHHIDNNEYNNRVENLLNVTMEQHASIHLYMWENFKIEDGFLKW